LNELPKILAREAQIDETLKDLDLQTRGIQSSVASSVSNLIREVEDPIIGSGADYPTTTSIWSEHTTTPPKE
jgi:hypothetical protein